MDFIKSLVEELDPLVQGCPSLYFFRVSNLLRDILIRGSWIRQATFSWGFSIKEVHPWPGVYGKIASSGNVVNLR